MSHPPTSTSTSTSTSDIPWKESRFHSHTTQEQDELEENDDMFAMFADPDPYQTFEFEFGNSSSDSNKDLHHITLHGHKQENGQTLHSTGLTLWRASELLCEYLVEHQELVANKRVVELGAGLGLCGILAHQLQASRVIMTDGDVDTLENMRDNVTRNGIELGMENGSMHCPQLIWGQQLPEFLKQQQQQNDGLFQVVLAADIIYVTEILEPLWETVDTLLAPQGLFLLAYARRNVPIDLVLEHATRRGFTWSCPENAEGVFLFRRQETKA